MRITLTGRRLALAAVLVIGGAAAPLAYATIANTKAAATSAAPAVPLVASSASSATTGAAVADNPYQLYFYIGGNVSGCFTSFFPPGQDFVLESVSVMTTEGAVSSFSIGPDIKDYGGGTVTKTGPAAAWEIPLDAGGDGTRTFNLLLRPDLLEAAAEGDVFRLQLCYTNANPPAFARVNLIFTGQRVVSSPPTAARVASFDATSGKAGATLHWKTASETEILGFNVWRYRGAKGVKVNRTLVRAKRSGEPAGASYRFIDRVPGAKRGLTYRLQLVDLKGKRTWYAAFAIASK